MDNQETLQQGFELPKPTTEGSVSGVGSAEVGTNPEVGMSGSSSAPAQSSVQSLLQTDPQALGATPALAVTAQTAHLLAEDADLIEKEWILKAKEIVAQTHGDPYRQNKEINKIKADYIKKRYNKDIVQQSGE